VRASRCDQLVRLNVDGRVIPVKNTLRESDNGPVLAERGSDGPGRRVDGSHAFEDSSVMPEMHFELDGTVAESGNERLHRRVRIGFGGSEIVGSPQPSRCSVPFQSIRLRNRCSIPTVNGVAMSGLERELLKATGGRPQMVIRDTQSTDRQPTAREDHAMNPRTTYLILLPHGGS
jgi:hypothetical protein